VAISGPTIKMNNLNYTQPYNIASAADHQNEVSLRQARRESQIGADQVEMESDMEGDADDGMTFRQRRALARRAEAKMKKEEESRSPTKIASARLLKWSWMSMATVFGFIIGLLYINIHAFSRLVMPSITCKFGTEWMPLSLKGIAGEMGKSRSKIMGFFEVMLLIILDTAVIFGLIFSLAIFMYILDWLLDGWIGFFVKKVIEIIL
jgi:hypothetical protein